MHRHLFSTPKHKSTYDNNNQPTVDYNNPNLSKVLFESCHKSPNGFYPTGQAISIVFPVIR